LGRALPAFGVILNGAQRSRRILRFSAGRIKGISRCGATLFARGGKEGKTPLEPTVAPCRFPRLNGAPIGVLPRNRLAVSAAGGASAVSLFGSRLPL